MGLDGKAPSVLSGQLPHSWGFGVYADAAGGGEGVFQQGQNKTYPPPSRHGLTSPHLQREGVVAAAATPVGDG